MLPPHITTTLSQRVERGIAHLDQHWPGWERHIDLGSLDIKSSCNCVIGQLCGSYDINRVGIYTKGREIHLGFDVVEGTSVHLQMVQLEFLTTLWRDAIEERAVYGVYSDAWADIHDGVIFSPALCEVGEG